MMQVLVVLFLVAFTWASLTHDEQHLKRALEVRHQSFTIEEGDD